MTNPVQKPSALERKKSNINSCKPYFYLLLVTYELGVAYSFQAFRIIRSKYASLSIEALTPE